MVCKHFSPMCCLFLFAYGFLCCANAFKFNYVPSVYFCFYFYYSGRWVEDLAVIYVIECSACFPLRVYSFWPDFRLYYRAIVIKTVSHEKFSKGESCIPICPGEIRRINKIDGVWQMNGWMWMDRLCVCFDEFI